MRPDSLLDKALALQASLEEGSLNSRGTHTAPHHVQFVCLLAGIAVVLGDRERHIAQVFVYQVVFAISRLAFKDQVFVYLALLVATAHMTEQSEVPARIPPAVADPLPIEDQLAV